MKFIETRKVPSNGYLSLKKLVGKQIAIYEFTEEDLLKLQENKIVNQFLNEQGDIE